MNLRERILAVYRGETPDVVPFMLDLSHWFYQKHKVPWDLSKEYDKPEYDLIDYHRKHGVGFYVPNNCSFYDVKFSDDVRASVSKSADGRVITWQYQTPLGTISRQRKWEEGSYSWAISDWGVKTRKDLRVLGYALASRTFSPAPQRYQGWVDYVGDVGVAYLSGPGYSGMGQLLGYWMGIEATIYATRDWPDTMHEVIDQINKNNLKCIDVAATYPAEVVILGDNFSSDVQPPAFFEEWSRPYYEEAIKRLHAAGKCVAVHIDGRLREALKMFRDIGADCADAVTPTPMGDLTPQQCRREAGPDFILSGGVSPNLWLPEVDVQDFKKAVIRWLELKKQGPRLIANAGDQVPPGADEEKIRIMRDMVEQYGMYS
ncbi:MAG: uroporphyrinogen decarboxylase family protein [Phycisphaerae bacterium]|nr:uroporphyrinogen decarboxylase family protein [Phycisphaerae bacterium]MDP7637420.1 uroporphyrinogen decarboxylase family protein [Phycisphaerae bacterium]